MLDIDLYGILQVSLYRMSPLIKQSARACDFLRCAMHILSLISSSRKLSFNQEYTVITVNILG